MVTVGVETDSLEVKLSVTVSPTFALELSALFEEIVTGLRVGETVSTIKSVPALGYGVQALVAPILSTARTCQL